MTILNFMKIVIFVKDRDHYDRNIFRSTDRTTALILGGIGAFIVVLV
jgi:hypothetical protein